jgi:hypothetical protein
MCQVVAAVAGPSLTFAARTAHLIAGQTKYSCISGYDYNGNNIQGIGVSSDAECRAACSNLAACTFYSMTLPSGGGYGCYLKKDLNAGRDGGTGYSSGMYHAC